MQADPLRFQKSFRPSRRRVLLATIVIATVATPLIAEANSALRGIMKSWKQDDRATVGMINGRAVFDEAAIKAVLVTYIEDANRIASGINGQSADARDIKSRFVVFQANAQNALRHISQRAALQSDYKRIASGCSACHDLYKD